ncbi:MAG: sigma-70 family RNA polymerase sigma factor [Planctomycetota bacterium]
MTEAFLRLHRELHDDLCAWAEVQLQAPLRRRIDPEDLVQEVWSRAYQAFRAYDETRGPFRAWLFGIAYHVLHQQLRTWRRRWRREGEAGSLDAVDGRTSIVSRLVRTERATRLVHLVESLSGDDRALVIHRGIEGLPHAEVAARLGVTAATAETRWRRLRGRLTEQLPE